ncbi:MAG: hypothetical protein KDB22_08235 [Planctomycetales bacterium]|nr:hypothetical protein [Planctomycetales bacterium]
MLSFHPQLFAYLLIFSAAMANYAVAQDGQPNPELATKAGAVLNDFCFRCHRGEGSSAGGYAFNARDVASMTDESVVTPESLEDSDLYNAMYRGRMPPRNQAGLPRPTAEDIDVIKQWIEAGTPEFPPIPRREFIPLVDVMSSMFMHYQQLDPRQRSHYRYFTLTNLWNDVNVDERQLRMTRAALAKALNSLSWEANLVEPEAVDEHKTAYAVDISQLGWTSEHWNALISDYPYHIESDSIVDGGSGDVVEKMRRIDEDMIRLSGNDRQIKHLRADWFVTIGLRPRLYHSLLYELSLPVLRNRRANNSPSDPKSMTDLDLENVLGIDVASNIDRRPVKARRVGFAESGISGQNRMIERHPLAGGGYYWKSYDFLGSNSRAILTEFPLGPARDGQDDFSFEHDGGEIIFTLPNGLQGYLLTTAKGARLDAGPIEIVGDALKTSGNQLIVNGLSCVVCHRKGMIEPPDDIVRGSAGAFGNLADRVRELYPETSQMQKLVAADSELFVRTMMRLLKPYLEDDDFQAIGDGFPAEPVGEVARWYLLQPMSLETVAGELYHQDIDTLRLMIKSDARARQIGIGQLKNESGTIKREAWHHIEGRSLMQQAADVLGYAPAE